MDIRNLKHSAAGSLSDTGYSPGRLVLIHTGAVLTLSLVLTAINQILDSTFGSVGGISGMETQAMLSTVQWVLQLVTMVVTPFWSAGLIFAALGYAGKRSVTPSSLLEGFRRWKPILSSGLMIGLRYTVLAFISMFLSSQLFMFTPFATPVYEAALQVTQNPELDIYALLGDSMTWLSVTYTALFLIVYALLALPVFYNYRMVNYLILDNPDMGGLQATILSRMMMRGKRLKLVKLDLSFWWYYALEMLCAALAFVPLLFSALDVSLPMSESVAFWLFQILSVLLQLALQHWAKPRLSVTYALCYNDFLPGNDPEPAPKPKPPRNLPWNY